jgi:hypothetical protein
MDFLDDPTLNICKFLDLSFILTSDKLLVNGESCGISFDEGDDWGFGMDK